MSDTPKSAKAESEDSTDTESEEEIVIPRESTLQGRTVSQHRKAFVQWVNEEMYPQVLQKVKDQTTQGSSLKVYQMLIQTYLGIDTPFRGLLVYHGLGTGKTASAVSLAEGLSSDLPIRTLLPASLETEFIKEVRRWGLRDLNEDNTWSYKAYKDWSKEELATLKETRGLDGKALQKILRQTQASYKKELIQESEATDEELESLLQTAVSEIKDKKGFWTPDPSGTRTEDLTPVERACVRQQIQWLISQKYNFIHYKPFPKVKASSIPELVEGEEDSEEDDEWEPGESKAIATHNQAIVKQLETRLKHNRKHHGIDSPFYKEVIIIDEVHNFVRQILNQSKTSLIFYQWIVNAKDVKLVFLSGTPVINKPCEIAILFNMLKGLIRVYSVSLQTTLSPEEMTKRLQEVIYASPSPIELFYVEPKQGKLVISFIQESSGFESLAETPEEGPSLVYTIQTQDASFQDFVASLYHAVRQVVPQDVSSLLPSEATFQGLSAKEIREIQQGHPRIFDTDLDLLFNRQQKLFDIYEEGRLVDMTNHEDFMRYFFESSLQIPDTKRVLLKRMLMGLTSYYPIDRTSIVEMPQIVKPKIHSEAYKGYLILKELNVVSCPMSQIQFEKYNEMWAQESAMDKLRTLRGAYDDDAPYHYHMRTRQTCNIIFRKDDFRTLKKTETNHQEIEDLKQRAYQDLLESRSLHYDQELSKVSPKMYEILKNMKTYTKDGASTGKVLFYSDFRADAGSEAFELVLKSNGYERFDTKKPQESKGLRYTFITGSESTEDRRIHKECYNEERNRYGEYIQVMIISSAGAEGLSLSCVRQVHLLEPYWNYVRIDQVLGRAIRMRSHTLLEPADRNVEQYLYLSVLPPGTNLDAVYESIRGLDTWEIPEWTDLKAELSKASHKAYKEVFEGLVNLNLAESELSTDQHLFEVMETKYKVSTEINAVIQESSLDCIPHTRDDPALNDRCIRFSKQLLGEIAYFPGISSHLLETLDTTQLLATTLVFLKPNVYVVSAYDTQRAFYVYYEHTLRATESRDEIDIRYLRENALKLGELHPNAQMFIQNVKDSPDDPRLGKEFSVFQKIYGLTEDHVHDLASDSFPTIAQLTKDPQWVGAKLKYNINQTFFYTEAECLRNPRKIFKMYPYGEYESHLYEVSEIPPIILYKKEFYTEDD